MFYRRSDAMSVYNRISSIHAYDARIIFLVELFGMQNVI